MRTRIHTVARWTVAISMVFTALFSYASSQLLDEDAFASLLSKSVESPEVRSLLAGKAVDVAIDASDADVLLAENLPDELAAIATPALEVTKPAIAEAGASLLGLSTVREGLDAAARSVHRQTSSAIIAEEPTDVIVNGRPILVVVADAIAGDVGARAAVGLDLPESATSINLGSNQAPVWAAIRLLEYLTALAALAWILAMIAYFVTAAPGRRLAAARRLGKTFLRSGIVLVGLAWLLRLIAAALIEVTLSTGEALSFAKFSVGGLTTGGGEALAQVLLGPLMSSARNIILYGMVIVAATYALGEGSLAAPLRDAIRQRDGKTARAAVREWLPHHVREIEMVLAVGLVVLLIMWPSVTLRVALTATAFAAALLAAFTVIVGRRAPWPQLRSLFDLPTVEASDATDRTERAMRFRRWLLAVGAAVAIFWPNYSGSSFVFLVAVFGSILALSYYWELKPSSDLADAEETANVEQSDSNVEAADQGWTWPRLAVVATALVIGVALYVVGGGNTNPASASRLAGASPLTCNGHAELCDVPVNEVAFAGTHNSMSASELGWELANHGGAIPAQMDAGIRALLIDVLEWTATESLDDLDLDPEAAAIASGAISAEAPQDGLWMCHQLCQLGATPFRDFLADLKAFLETNPDEVLIIVIQDEAPAADIQAAIVGADVDDFAFTHRQGEPWPTLAEMITTNKRLIFMAENEAGSADWYQLAFEGNVSETGFRYNVLEEFECSANRGADDGAFFMINHWVETGLPVPAEADEVNSKSVLQERVDECEAERNRAPGIIAVNFWERGDLFAVVDDANGVGSTAGD